MLGLALGSGLRFYSAVYNFSQFYTLHIAQMQNGYGVKTTVRVSVYCLGLGLQFVLRSRL